VVTIEADPPRIGFVGLGAIGRPLVESLLRAGVPTVVHDLDHDAVAHVVAQGAEAAASPRDLAARSRVISVCVPADDHVRAVLDGSDGLLAHLPRGAVVAIISTVMPTTIEWAAQEAARYGVAVVEAAITGGTMAAAEGRSTFLLAGDQHHIDALAPLLDSCGAARVVVDRLGDANRLKLFLNLQSYATFTGVFEAATLARAIGLPLDALKAAMAANGQLGELVENYLLGHDFTPDQLEDPAINGILEGYAAIIEKDLDLVARLADDAGVPVESARLARRLARRVYFLEDRP
jgi:3-hydroxyisobutyrate dehydrogenase-like beta-hydroxyacid dehydrogenase